MCSLTSSVLLANFILTKNLGSIRSLDPETLSSGHERAHIAPQENLWVSKSSVCLDNVREPGGGVWGHGHGENTYTLQHTLGLNQGPWRSEVASLLHTAPSAEIITIMFFLPRKYRFCSQPYRWHTHFVTGSFLSVQDAMDLDIAVLFAHAEQSLVHRRSYQRIFNVLPGLFVRSDLKSKHMKFHSYTSVTPFNRYLVRVAKVSF